jgi:hypothetical protein
MSNYTKYIRPGYQIICAGVPNTVAAFSPTTSTLVLVTYNNTGSNVSNTYNLTGFASVAASANQFRTSASENLASIGTVAVSNKILTATRRQVRYHLCHHRGREGLGADLRSDHESEQ